MNGPRKAAEDYPRMVIMQESLKLENNREEIRRALEEIDDLRSTVAMYESEPPHSPY